VAPGVARETLPGHRALPQVLHPKRPPGRPFFLFRHAAFLLVE